MSHNNFIFWNCANGVIAKFDAIEYYIKTKVPDIFFIAEAEIKKSKDYSCMSFPGYQAEFSSTLTHGV